MLYSKQQMPRTLSPLATAAVIAVSVFAAVGLSMMFKKEIGCAAKEMRRFGQRCADAVEDTVENVKESCCSDKQ